MKQAKSDTYKNNSFGLCNYFYKQFKYNANLKYRLHKKYTRKGVKNLYEKYERLLKKTGETTYQVCRATNIPESTISMWRDRCVNQGKDAKLSVDNLAKLAKHFGVSIDYFIED